MKSREKAIEAIRDLHADTSVNLSSTLAALDDVRDICDELIEAVKADLDMEEN